MPHGPVLFMVLLFLPLVSGVCRHCHGDIPHCGGGDGDDNCISFTGTATNAAVLLSTTAASLNVVKLLPSYLLRIFTRRVLDGLVAVARRPLPTEPYDTSSKSPGDIIQAVGNRLLEPHEAVVYLGGIATSLTVEAGPREAALAAIKVIEAMRGAQGTQGGADRNDYGAFLYIFALCQAYILTTFSCGICIDASSSTSEPSSSSSGRLPSARVRTPPDFASFAESLNLFVMVCAASGAALSLVTTRFIQDAVYHPMRRHGIQWPVAFELFILYLEQIDIPQGAVLTFSTVLTQGGLDIYIAQATESAKTRFGSAFAPSGGRGDFRKPLSGPSSESVRGSSRPEAGICPIFNFEGRPHEAWHCVNGVCKKRHVCNQYVNNKGKNGRCEGKHPYYQCTNTAKCSREEAAALD